jgi:hypothetical protein
MSETIIEWRTEPADRDLFESLWSRLAATGGSTARTPFPMTEDELTRMGQAHIPPKPIGWWHEGASFASRTVEVVDTI